MQLCSCSIFYSRIFSRPVRLTTIRGFDFDHVVTSVLPLRFSPPNLMQISQSSLEMSTFPEIRYGGRRHLGFSWKVKSVCSGFLTVWCLSSVPNLVRISSFVHDGRLMTSRELTLSFWSRGLDTSVWLLFVVVPNLVQISLLTTEIIAFYAAVRHSGPFLVAARSKSFFMIGLVVFKL